jgi:C-terminal processing protease CtpA/Prc
VNFQPATPADAYAHQRDILRTKLLAAERICYVQYNRCEGRETAERRGDRETAARLPSLQALFDSALTELRAAVGDGRADTLVFDVRFNSGGASDFGTRFAQQVAGIAALRRPGRVFVIIGRRTFSSAILNAQDFKRLLAARFVGEPTSGTANHYGEVRTFTLPSSHLVVGYSTKYFGEPGGRLDPLQPDIPAEMSFAEFNEGVDPVLAAIARIRALSAGRPSIIPP